jgi:hypothetical protein
MKRHTTAAIVPRDNWLIRSGGPQKKPGTNEAIMAIPRSFFILFLLANECQPLSQKQRGWALSIAFS